MFTKEQLIHLLRNAAGCKPLSAYYFGMSNGDKIHLDDVLSQAADMLEGKLVDQEESSREIDLNKSHVFLVDKPFTYLSRRFEQGDILRVIGRRKSDGCLTISINDDMPIVGGNISDLRDMINNNFISGMN